MLTTINSGDGYQSSQPNDAKTTWMRFTSGGRLEYSTYNWYFTVAAISNMAKTLPAKKLDAYYIQPEIKYTNKAWSVRLGLEYLSGQDSSLHQKEDKTLFPSMVWHIGLWEIWIFSPLSRLTLMERVL